MRNVDFFFFVMGACNKMEDDVYAHRTVFHALCRMSSVANAAASSTLVGKWDVEACVAVGAAWYSAMMGLMAGGSLRTPESRLSRCILRRTTMCERRTTQPRAEGERKHNAHLALKLRAAFKGVSVPNLAWVTWRSQALTDT